MKKPSGMKDQPRTGMSARAGYVRDIRARMIAAGARMTPRGLLHKPAADALRMLVYEGYERSQTKVIERALIEAAERIKKGGKAAGR